MKYVCQTRNTQLVINVKEQIWLQNMLPTVDMYWDIHMQHGRHIYSEAYANYVKCVFTRISGHIFVALFLYIKLFAYMSNMWHLRNIFVFGTYMAMPW